MSTRSQGGLSLVELILVVLLLGLVGSSAIAIVTTALRSFQSQAARAQIQATLRTAVTVVGSELRELGAGSPGDLAEIGLHTITYRAKRSTAFLCRKPDALVPEITAWGDPVYGLRPLEAGRDSILVFAENDPRDSDDNAWHSAMVVAVISGRFCPGPARGILVRLAGLAPGSLSGVERGAPVRGFQASRLVLYRDSRRSWWLGHSEYRAQNGWSITQPVLGPLSSGGFRLEYLDWSGEPATEPRFVRVIGMTVVAQSSGRVASVLGLEPMRDSLTTYVALRNGLPVEPGSDSP
jgi:hypothetical protein